MNKLSVQCLHNVLSEVNNFSFPFPGTPFLSRLFIKRISPGYGKNDIIGFCYTILLVISVY